MSSRPNRAARRRAALMPPRTPERVAGYRHQWRELAQTARRYGLAPERLTPERVEEVVALCTGAQHHWGHPFEGLENHACEPLTTSLRRLARAQDPTVRVFLAPICIAASLAMLGLLDRAEDASAARAPDPETQPQRRIRADTGCEA